MFTFPPFNSQSTYVGDIGHSLRFRASASAYLSRVDANNSTSQKVTFSHWLKRGDVQNAYRALHTVVYDINNRYLCLLDTSGGVVVRGIAGGATTYYKISGALQRDPTGHTHILVAYDSTLAVAEDRIKLFVNGVRTTSFPTTNSNPAQNSVIWQSNTLWVHRIGQDHLSGYYLDGYLSRIAFVDGQALTPSSFGYFNSEINEWVSKTQSEVKAVVDAGGANSFMLDFDNGTSLTTLGYDKSSKGNNWTLNNFSLTAGPTYDWMLDVPGNSYCVLNPLSVQAVSAGTGTVSNANLTMAATGTSNGTGIATYSSLAALTGLYYAECTVTATSGASYSLVGVETLSRANWCKVMFCANTNSAIINTAAGNVQTGLGFVATGDVISVTVDCSGMCTFRNNNTVIGIPQTFTVDSGVRFFSGPRVGGAGANLANFSWNFGQRPFAYTPPTGFKALCQANMPEVPVAIRNPTSQFQVKLDTGANIKSTAESVFPSNFFEWIKDRANANNHQLIDTVRGASAVLQSNTTAAETTYSAPSGSSVGWVWKAGGAPVTNNAGSIQSQVSANVDAGFSIVSFALQATGSKTVGHGLSKAPELLFFKSRTGAYNWFVYNAAVGATGYLLLNATAAAAIDSTVWNNTAPTTSVFTVGSGFTSANYGTNQIAYCFHSVEGFSKIGSYTGNGSADGPFVHCGFKPRFVLIKRVDTSGYSWILIDTARDPVNDGNNQLLHADASGAESTGTSRYIDFVSTGFKPKGSEAGINASGATYIFYAIAETSGKYSTGC